MTTCWWDCLFEIISYHPCFCFLDLVKHMLVFMFGLWVQYAAYAGGWFVFLLLFSIGVWFFSSLWSLMFCSNHSCQGKSCYRHLNVLRQSEAKRSIHSCVLFLFFYFIILCIYIYIYFCIWYSYVYFDFLTTTILGSLLNILFLEQGVFWDCILVMSWSIICHH